jgi:hypothetical protein
MCNYQHLCQTRRTVRERYDEAQLQTDAYLQGPQSEVKLLDLPAALGSTFLS